MLRISKKSEYGIIALKHLLNQPEGAFSRAKEIAELYNIPSEALAKILQTLVRRGIVKSIQGARGGYVLATGGEETTLSQIIESIDGPVGIVDCVLSEAEEGDCTQSASCNIVDPFRIIQEQFMTFLSRISLSDINNEIEMRRVTWH